MNKWISFFCFSLCSSIVYAADIDENTPVDFSADDLEFHQQEQAIYAHGNVSFVQGDSFFKADNVHYSVKDQHLKAIGNVQITTPDGGVLHADEVDSTDNFNNDVVGEVRYVLSDHSIATAKRGQRLTKIDEVHGDFTQLDDTRYSTCDYCINGLPIEDESQYTNKELDEKAERFWEIRAKKITHYSNEHDMYAENIFFYAKDVPILWMPWLKYPDPSVKRRTGFLIPGYKSNDRMKHGVLLPFYVDIKELVPSMDADFIYTPWISNDGILSLLEYRQKFKDADLFAKGSFIDHRGSLDLNFDWRINDIWRFKVDLEEVSSSYYNGVYDIKSTSEPWYTSTVDLQALTTDTYFDLKAIKYRNLRTNVDSDTMPKVLPRSEFVQYISPFDNNSYFTLGASTVSLYRDNHVNTNRGSINIAYHLPGITHWGLVYEGAVSLVGSQYDVHNYVREDGSVFSGQPTSAMAQTSLKFSYPFVNIGENFNQVVEPIVMVVAAPNHIQSKNIPNEDSNNLDFSDIDLFSETRYTGYDRIEAGSRLNYGLKWSAYDNVGRSISFLVGQSHKYSDRNEVDLFSGIYEKDSDVVGRFQVNDGRFISLAYAFRVDKSNYRFNRSDVTLGLGNDPLRLNVSYLYTKDRMKEVDRGIRESFEYALTSKLTQNWSLNFAQTLDLKSKGKKATSTKISARYENECFALEFSFTKDYSVANYKLNKNGKNIDDLNAHQLENLSSTSYVVFVEIKPFGRIAF